MTGPTTTTPMLLANAPRTGSTWYRLRFLLREETFCESEQCCEVSPKFGNFALKPAEAVLLRP
jgi:hypothetical protein